VARCVHGEVPAEPATLGWHKDLRCWHPGFQSGMFALPRNVQAQLGLR